MGIVEALILGAVQGITEFLPISSSGHLVLFQKIFGISESALLFDTMVHAGTLAAVFVVLRKDVWGILRRPVQPLTGLLILATLPAVAVALVFKDFIESAFRSGDWLGFAFILTAAALLVSERRSKEPPAAGSGEPPGLPVRPRFLADMNWLDALIIGVLQGAAIIPGVSRSGLTLSGALSRKLDREDAARFSFLLSVPAILGALVLQLKDLLGSGPEGLGMSPGGIGPAPLIAGTLTAAVVGFFSIRLMLRIVRERSLRGFAVYTAVLGALVLADRYGSRLFF
jgi:undecaprenyl-diphosphatase